MFFNYNYITSLFQQWAYHSIYYATCAQDLFIRHLQRPAYRCWNWLSPPQNSWQYWEYCPETKQCVSMPMDNPNKLIITRVKTYCPKSEAYEYTDTIHCINKSNESDTSAVSAETAKNKIKTSKVPILCIEIQFKNNNNDEIKKTIELSSDKYNYDVKGNQICSQFIDYFVHTHHPAWIEEHQLALPFQDTMNIVASNINEITLTDEDILLLKTTE